MNLRDEVTKVINDSKYADTVSQFGVTNRQLTGLKLLSKITREKDEYKISDEEKQFLNAFIKSSYGDMRLNEAIRKNILPHGYAETLIDGLACSYMQAFAYRTRRIKTFNEVVFDKAVRLFEILNQDKIAKPKERLTIGEFAILRDIATQKELFDMLNKNGLLDNDVELQKLYEKMIQADKIVRYLDNEFKEKFKFPSGAIIFDSTAKKAEIYDKSIDLAAFIQQTFATEYGHVSKGYTVLKSPKSPKSPKISDADKKKSEEKDLKTEVSQKIHINPGVAKEEFNLLEFLYSDVYVIKLDKLISAEKKELLRKCYGEDWLEKINAEYQKIERELHDKQFQVSASGTLTQITSGVLTLSYFNRFSKMIPFDFIKKHFVDTHQDIHQRFIFSAGLWDKSTGKTKKGVRMLCSEFVGYLTITALVELNKRIEEQLFKNGFPVTNNVIKIPIDESEYLHGMHPERLLTILKECDCVERLAGPRSFHRMIRVL
ncbi:MAG: hypothetical protein ACYCQI_09340 [Gammaproteobacteria bacterium]